MYSCMATLLTLLTLQDMVGSFNPDCSYQTGYKCVIHEKVDCNEGISVKEIMPSAPTNLTVQSINGGICLQWKMQEDASRFYLEGFLIKAFPLHNKPGESQVCNNFTFDICRKLSSTPKSISHFNKFLFGCIPNLSGGKYAVSVLALPFHADAHHVVSQENYKHDGCEWIDIKVEKDTINTSVLGNRNPTKYTFKLFRCTTIHCHGKQLKSQKVNNQAIFKNVASGIYLIEVTCHGQTCYRCGDQTSREVYPIAIVPPDTQKFAVDKENINCEIVNEPNLLMIILLSVILVTMVIIAVVMIVLLKRRKLMCTKKHTNSFILLLYSFDCEEHSECCKTLTKVLQKSLGSKIKPFSIHNLSKKQESQIFHALLSAEQIIIIHSEDTSGKLMTDGGTNNNGSNVYEQIRRHHSVNRDRFTSVRFGYSSELVVPFEFRVNCFVLMAELSNLVHALLSSSNGEHCSFVFREHDPMTKLLSQRIVTAEPKYCKGFLYKNSNNEEPDSGYVTSPIPSMTTPNELLIDNRNDENPQYKCLEPAPPEFFEISNVNFRRSDSFDHYHPHDTLIYHDFIPPKINGSERTSNISISTSDLNRRLQALNQSESD